MMWQAAVNAGDSITTEHVLLLQNVFSYYRMCSLAAVNAGDSGRVAVCDMYI